MATVRMIPVFPDGTGPLSRLAAAGCLLVAVAVLRLLPLRAVLAIARVSAIAMRRHPTRQDVSKLADARDWAAALWPGRAACLETSLATYLAAAFAGYHARWVLGCRLGPASCHAWTETCLGPVGEPTGSDQPLHATLAVGHTLACINTWRAMNADRLSAAISAVPREHYTDHPELGAPPQTTAQKVIERDIARLGVDLDGRRVLEIGTGTGYTGALLAELVGPAGSVVSMDIDARLVERARTLHAERGCPVVVLSGDGHDGAPDHGPYDVIVGWCTPTHLPGAWIKQVRPGGIISTPIYVASVARTVGHLRAVVTEQGDLADVTLGSAVYVDMGGKVNDTLGAPLFYVDASSGESYVSVAWRDRDDDPEATLALLNSPGHIEPYPIGLDGADAAAAWRDARAYCAARDHALGAASFSTWGTGAPGWETGFGFSSGRNAAMLADSWQIRANTATSPALAKLRDYLKAWEDAGRPGLEQLGVDLVPGDSGWQVHATLPADWT